MASRHRSRDEPPWEHANPKPARGEKTRHLTPAQKASAKRAAKKAGRPYPNLVDNMRVAAKARRRREH